MVNPKSQTPNLNNEFINKLPQAAPCWLLGFGHWDFEVFL